jgi:hypothetical protein
VTKWESLALAIRTIGNEIFGAVCSAGAHFECTIFGVRPQSEVATALLLLPFPRMRPKRRRASLAAALHMAIAFLRWLSLSSTFRGEFEGELLLPHFE